MESNADGTCPWAGASAALRAYHDEEWGRPCHHDRQLFEMLILEGAQAGLSWSTILGKRAGYRAAFDDFDPERIAGYGEAKVAELLADPGIVRNRMKVRATIANAAAYLALAEVDGSLDRYLWAWVDGQPIVNRPGQAGDVASRSDLSDGVSKDLKRRGFAFVGTTIVYSWLQAVGVVDDHLDTCPAKPLR